MGLVYTIVFPLIVIASLIYGVFTVLKLIVEIAPRLIHFFKGEEFFPTLREDKEVALVMKTQHERMLNGAPPSDPAAVSQPAPTAVYVQNNYYTQSAAPTAAQPSSLPPATNQPFPQYIDGNGAYIQNQIPTQNQANPSLISQNPVQIPNNTNQQVAPALVSIPTYKPQPDSKSVAIDPLGDNDDNAA